MLKNPPATAGDIRDLGLIPGSGRSPGGGNGNPVQYLAWRIPWTREAVRHDSSTFARTHACLYDGLTSFKYYDSSTVWLSFFFRFTLHFAILAAEMSLIFLHFHDVQMYICFIFAHKQLLFFASCWC